MSRWTGVRLTQRRALCLGIEGVEGCRAAHEEPIALGPAEAEIGNALGGVDFSYHFCVRGINGHTVITFAATHSDPEIAVPIAAHSVRHQGAAGDEHLGVGNLRPVVHHVENPDLARGCSGFDNVEFLLVRGSQLVIGPLGRPS